MSKEKWPYTNRVIRKGYPMGDKKTLTRHKVRRKLEQCATLCDNINQHLGDCAQPFEDAKHPAHDAFIQLGTITEMLKQFLVSFRASI